MYIVNDPSDTLVSILVDSNNDAAISVIDANGNVVIYADARLSGVESGSGITKVEAPYFVVVSQYTEGPGIFRVSSDRSLVLYDDPDDGREIAVGHTVAGALDYPTDVDYFVINLSAGESVEISVTSVMVDPLIAVDYLGATEDQVARDNDSGGGIFGQDSSLDYTAPKTGTYFIVIEDAVGTKVGGYFLTVAPGETVTSTAAPAEVFSSLTALTAEKEMSVYSHRELGYHPPM